jgi:N-acetylmuramoyl-L-alanine amidase CwlD
VSREKKHLIRLLLLTLIILVLLGSPAAAAITGFVAMADDGELYEYSYGDLLDSYALKILGLSNGLYEDFVGKKPYALINSSGGYIDYADVLDRYAAALILNQKFDLSTYLAGEEAKKAQMPASLNVINLKAGNLITSAKTLSSNSTEANSIIDGTKNKTLIIGSAEATLEQAQQWAKNREAHQRFIDIAPLYWEYGRITGIRPEVLYAQSAVETNFGKYTNKVPPEFNNWAGIKIADAQGDAVESHEIFASPDNGVRAHYNHISAYVGLEPVGEPHGRYFVIARQSWAGSIRYVEELSGKWTPMTDYHSYILNLLDQIRETKVANSNTGSGAVDPNTEDLLKPVPDNGSPLERYVAVNEAALRLRSGPGTDYDIIRLLNLGTILTVTGNQAEWLLVITSQGENGWVHGDHVSEIEIDLSVNPFVGKIIVVDPGHGGSDPGAVSASGIQEKVINLAVAQKLAPLLESAGATVIMTRKGDQSLTNQQRVEIANQSKGDIYISIHANAYANNESNGTETHYCSENSYSSASRYLAHQLQSELVSALNLRDRGVKQNSYYILKNTKMPAALVEMAFLTNPAEEEILKSAEMQAKAAQALYLGLEAFLLK